jgi:hypothetical protein
VELIVVVGITGEAGVLDVMEGITTGGDGVVSGIYGGVTRGGIGRVVVPGGGGG